MRCRVYQRGGSLSGIRRPGHFLQEKRAATCTGYLDCPVSSWPARLEGGTMPSLLESFAQFRNPEIIGQLGKAVGLDGTTTAQGLDVAGPLLTSAMAHSASMPGGLDTLMGMVSQVSASSTPGELM